VGTADDGRGLLEQNNITSGVPTAAAISTVDKHNLPVLFAAGQSGSCTSDTEENFG
jgi:hypothetical protein